MNVTIPVSTRKNGSLYAHVFLGPEGKSPLHSSDRQHMSLVTVPVTKYAIPEAQTFNLFTGSAKVGISRELASLCSPSANYGIICHFQYVIIVH